MKENLEEILEVANDLSQWHIFLVVEHYKHSEDNYQRTTKLPKAITKPKVEELLEKIKDGVIEVDLESGYRKKIIDIEITHETFKYHGIQRKPKVKKLIGETGQLSLF